jgi:hypothetical protein
LKQLGGEYSPQFLNQLEFDNIINSDNERGQGKGQGNQQGMQLRAGQPNSINAPNGPQMKKGSGSRGAGRK